MELVNRVYGRKEEQRPPGIAEEMHNKILTSMKLKGYENVYEGWFIRKCDGMWVDPAKAVIHVCAINNFVNYYGRQLNFGKPVADFGRSGRAKKEDCNYRCRKCGEGMHRIIEQSTADPEYS